MRLIKPSAFASISGSGLVYGGVDEELITLNHDTLWSGIPRDFSVPGGRDALSRAREALFQRDFVAAEKFCRKLQGPYGQSYLPMGSLRLRFPSTGDCPGGVHYERRLDLNTATATVSFARAGVRQTREYFTSAPDQVLVARLCADKPGSLSFTATLDSLLRGGASALNQRALIYRGEAPVHMDPVGYRKGIRYGDELAGGTSGVVEEGLSFAIELRATLVGGRSSCDETGLHIEGADEVILTLAAATIFSDHRTPPRRATNDPARHTTATLDAIENMPFSSLVERHRADYMNLFIIVSVFTNK